ncbi:MAG: 3-phosphoshikimate 1-carboxyvinyltransferase [Nitrospiraceae bacterium]|nr:3-phosphoshikimate 1-carboxyvinyltransferase [Nitrospiraceae bacterium]
MDRIEIKGTKVFRGEVTPPPDKSISHRAVFFSSLAKGTGSVRNFLRAQDTLSTMHAFRSLGVDIRDDGQVMIVTGKGIHGLSEPSDVINCGNSGTTIRLLSGVLSGNPFFSVLTGDDSLRSRPMARVITPLSRMGAVITARAGDRYPPLAIRGGGLKPLSYEMPMASAQVKSSILLAGLYAGGETVVTEPARSRDHTERMLPAFGADLRVDGLNVTVRGGRDLSPVDIVVPGDISSAAFFMVAALVIPGAEVMIRNVCINPTRTGIIEALRSMGAVMKTENVRDISGEPVADIYCRGEAGLKSVEIGGEIVPSLIDEFPILCVAAALADGVTTIRGAEELRVKESDRIAAMAAELRKMGVEIEEFPDGLSIRGTGRLTPAVVESHGDHRIAMAMTVAGLAAEGVTVIQGASAVGISFPDFFDMIGRCSS